MPVDGADSRQRGQIRALIGKVSEQEKHGPTIAVSAAAIAISFFVLGVWRDDLSVIKAYFAAMGAALAWVAVVGILGRLLAGAVVESGGVPGADVTVKDTAADALEEMRKWVERGFDDLNARMDGFESRLPTEVIEDDAG